MNGLKKILVVDDEPEVLKYLKLHLESLGFSVLTAGDGMAAVDVARAERPDLILLDLMIPALDGYRVLKLLKSDERFQRIPILVITARADTENVSLALECGADGYLMKPLQMDLLQSEIDAHICD